MIPAELRSYISSVMERLPPSSGKNLSGMLLDCESAVAAGTLFMKVKAARTGDPYRLVEVYCRTQVSRERVVQELEKIWSEELRYQSEPEAHCITIKNGEVFLDGITEIASLYFVTIRIVAVLP